VSLIVKKKRNKIRRFALLGLALVLMLVSACSPSSPPEPIEPTTPQPTTRPTELPENGDDLGVFRGLPGARDERMNVAVLDADGLNFNPFSWGEGRFPVDPCGHYQPIYETVVRFLPEDLEYHPVLVSNIVKTDDSIQLALNRERQWHDGFFVTGQDIIFSINAHIALGTATGRILAELVIEMTMPNDQLLILNIDNSSVNAANRVLDALSRTLIVPRHHWESLLLHGTAAEDFDAIVLPLVGSGPWQLIQRDEFALSFSRFSIDSTGEASYFTLLRYHNHQLVREALEHDDLDLVLCAPFCGADLTQKNLTSGEKLAGIALNPKANEWLASRPFRQLLGLSADTAQTGPLLMPNSSPIEPSDLLTIPSVMTLLDRKLLSEVLLAKDEATVQALLEEAGLQVNGTTGLLERDNVPLKTFELIYPEGSVPIEEALGVFLRSAREQGIPISLRRVTVDRWRQYEREGNYELIYQESFTGESPVNLIDRLLGIPTVSLEKDELLLKLGEAKRLQEKIKGMEQLASWLIKEQLFIPLAGGEAEVGWWRSTRFTADDLAYVLSAQTEFHLGE
jgi:hypothetical protein